MSAPNNDGAQFKAEADGISAEERAAMEILEVKRAEREAKAAAAADAPVVIDDTEPVKPEDDAIHMDLAQFAEQHEDGELYDSRTGKRVEWNEDGLLREAAVWPHRTVTYMEYVWEYRDPKKLALMFMSLSSNTKTSPKRRMEAMLGFLEHCLSSLAMDHMIARAFDHEDKFDTEHMGRLMQFITQKIEGDQDQAALNRAQKRAAGELE